MVGLGWQVCRGRDVFIMGESFGGLLALGTALDTLKKPGATGNM
jgi:alpha-beta hydrolase superfamily lysophospholipase